MPLLLVQTNCPDHDTARMIGDALVTERLAGSYNLDKIESAYHWNGAIEHEAEVRVTIKTRAALWPRVEVRIAALHPYDVPAIIGIAPAFVSGRYQTWLDRETLTD